MMLRKFISTLAASAALVGCAPIGMQMPMVGTSPPASRTADGLDAIRFSSLADVEGYSRDVAVFMYGSNKEVAAERAKKFIADSLKDPESAQFRDVRVVPYSDGYVVCGQVNGKNSYGGYVGFKRFVASTTEAYIATNTSKYADINDAANTGLNRACGHR